MTAQSEFRYDRATWLRTQRGMRMKLQRALHLGFGGGACRRQAIEA